MKVIGPHTNGPLSETPKAKDSAPGDDPKAFERLLAEAMDREGLERVGGNPGIPPALGHVGSAVPDTQAQELQTAEGRIQRVLDGLQDLVEQLNGRNPDWKDAGRLMESLGSAAEEAWSATRDLPADHPLRRLAEEARVVAYVESIKWKRGDYLGF